MTTISTDKLTIRFHTRAGIVNAVDGVSLAIDQGETFGVIGESGSGKTTLGRALVGLLKPTSGDILYEGRSRREMSSDERRQVRHGYQIIFQDPHAALNPRMTILQSMMEPLEVFQEGDRRTRRQLAFEALERVGLPPEAGRRYPHELSGGQKQRINIARTLTVKPKFIVCDEVTAALDVSIRGSVLNLLAELQKDLGITYAFITHDISVVEHISDRIGVLYLGRLMELAPTESLISQPLHPYTYALLSAEPVPLPSDRRDASRRIRLEGEIPSPLSPPSGCPFRTRCPAAQPLCAEEVPEWRQLQPDHWVACHFATADSNPITNPRYVRTHQAGANATA